MRANAGVRSTDRDLVLARIRHALRDVPSTEQPGDVDVPREYHITAEDAAPPRADDPSPPRPDLLALFAERAADYRASVTLTGPDGLPLVIARLLRERAVTRLVAPPGLPEEFLSLANGPANGLATGIDGTPVEILRDDPPLSVADLDACDAVVSGAALAVAATGTIVLDGGPGQGRRALTLLPDYHLCVVRADQIVADLTVAVRRLDPAKPLTLISGPSATSDIENTRVEGVHGPRTLDIVLLSP